MSDCSLTVSFGGQSVQLEHSAGWDADLRPLFGSSSGSPLSICSRLRLVEPQSGHFEIHENGTPVVRAIKRDDVPVQISEFVTHRLASSIEAGAALHAGAVGWHDRSVLVPGHSGVGKSSLVAWFVEQGFDYLTDELTLLAPDGISLTGFPRALMLKDGAHAVTERLAPLTRLRDIRSGTRLLLQPDGPNLAPQESRPCRLVIFPSFRQGVPLKLTPVKAVDTAIRLMTHSTNAGNLADGGFGNIVRLSRSVPAFELCYSDFEQLTDIVDTLAKLLLVDDVEPARVERLIAAFSHSGSATKSIHESRRPIPAPTVRRGKATLTIGMATYDDYDGVFFTLQAIRMYHPEIVEHAEFVVVDNHPDGPCAESLKALESRIHNYRYVPETMRSGTTVKGRVFQEASGDFVLCIDCHVFVVRGAIARLLEYFIDNRSTRDLLQGPLLKDDLTSLATHMRPEWSMGMYGVWDDNGLASDPDGPPFEIPMQGMGLFACSRTAWLGFNDAFRGFGGEEGYIHEKFRQAGARTLCLPYLRWMHRFDRPMGIPSQNLHEDRIWNYLVGFRELGLPTAEMETHFRGLIGEPAASSIFEGLKRELAGRR